MRLAGRVALVTGASRGIGAATARALAAEGAAVAVNYRRDQAGAIATRDAINGGGGTAIVVEANVADPAAVERLVETVSSSLGPIDVLVNNAAAPNRRAFLEVSLEELDAIWAANVRGVYHLSQVVARSMAERRRGVIVHLSSILARLSVPNRTAYSLTKGALESLTRAMAVDLAPFGVRVNAVAPGLIATEMLLAGMPDPERRGAVAGYIPEGRFGDPIELAAAVVFLCSDEASYLTGAVIPVDGGLGAREAGPP